MIRCLIIAGGSYVGQHIVRALYEAGFAVEFTYRTRSQNVCLLEKLPGVSSIYKDFSQPTSIDGEYDIVINSCGAYITGSDIDDQIVMPNVNSTIAALNVARRSVSTKLIINYSSLSVYGWPLPLRLNSETPAAPTDIYGTTKLLSEQILALAYSNAAIVNLRFPVVLGKNAHRAFLPTTLKRLLANESVTMTNCDERYFACTTLGNIAALTINLIRNPPVRGKIYSLPLGCEPDLTIRETIELMRAHVSSTSELLEKRSTSSSTIIDSTEACKFGYKLPILSECITNWLNLEGLKSQAA
jgi:nucleoside-diphosphate-sugar epimerase